MKRDISSARAAAERIRTVMFPSARAFLLAGSVVRGEATPASDIDLVVVRGRVEHAKRQSFTFAEWPVEAFIHDPQTLEYFFREVDRPTGVPSLATMVREGIEIPRRSACGTMIKELANRVLDEGPVPWGQSERDDSRYAISDIVADIREPRSPDELRPAVSILYFAIANHFCRSRNQWSAKGKHVPGRLMALDPEFGNRFTDAFEAAFTRNDTAKVIELAEAVLEPDGGFLFDGYGRDAPRSWRVSDP